jgi:DNA-binding NarL/FixJ family response regulator
MPSFDGTASSGTCRDIDVIAEADDGEPELIQQRPDVMLDIQMPKASGIELPAGCVLMRESWCAGATAFDDDPYVMAVLQAGANGYVLKTASPMEIIQAVRDVHAGKSAVNSVIAQKLISQFTRQTTEPVIEPLTEREVEVLAMAAKGYTNKAIGAQLGISDRTVQGHLAHIFDKMNATSRTEAVMRAVSLGWIPQNVVNNLEDER